MNNLIKKLFYFYTIFQIVISFIYCLFYDYDFSTAIILGVLSILALGVCINGLIKSKKARNSDDIYGAYIRDLKKAFPYSKSLQLRFEDAIFHINRKRYDRGIQILESLKGKCESSQSLCVVLNVMGLAYRENEDLDMALKCFNQAISCDSRSSNTWMLLANVQYKLNMHDKAEESFTNAILYNHKNNYAYSELAGLYFDKYLASKDEKYLYKTIESAKTAVDLAPKNYEPYQLLVIGHSLLNEKELAYKYFNLYKGSKKDVQRLQRILNSFLE